MIIRCRDPLRYGAQTPQESGSSESKALVVVEFISSILCLPLHPYWSIMEFIFFLFYICIIILPFIIIIIIIIIILLYLVCIFSSQIFTFHNLLFNGFDYYTIPILERSIWFSWDFFFIMDDMAIFLFFLFIPRLILFKF